MNDVRSVSANPWPRRLVLGGLFLLSAAAAVSAWAYWNWLQNASELREVLAVLDETDPGWRLEDLEKARAPVPDAENAAVVILSAHRLMPANTPSQAVADLFDDLPPPARLNDAQAAALRDLLGRTGPALAEARKLAELSRGRFPITYGDDGISTVLTS